MLWDGSRLTGELANNELSFTAETDGLTLTLQVSQVTSITRRIAFPPPEVTRDIEKLIARLGSDSYQQRVAAQEALSEMGECIGPLLEKHANDPNLEIRIRLAEIMQAVGIGQRESKPKPDPRYE